MAGLTGQPTVFKCSNFLTIQSLPFTLKLSNMSKTFHGGFLFPSKVCVCVWAGGYLTFNVDCGFYFLLSMSELYYVHLQKGSYLIIAYNSVKN